MDALHRAGATLVVEAGKTRVRGAKVSDELMARANDYFERGVKADDCDWRACVDVIVSRRECDTKTDRRFGAGWKP